MSGARSQLSSLIAIETAGAVCGAALWIGGKCVAEENRESGHGHAALLAPMIERIARQIGLPMATLGAVAATIGPGGFTGIRVGLAMARGLALGARCPAIGIDGFQRLAHSAQRAGKTLAERTLVVIDSRRAELFAALLDGRLRQIEAAFLTNDAVAAAKSLAATAILSDHPKAISWSAGPIPVLLQQPMAAAVGELALMRDGAFRQPALPRYLRAPDVTTPSVPAKEPAIGISRTGAQYASLLEDLHRRIFAPPWDRQWSVKSFLEVLAMPSATAWIITLDHAPVGFGIVQVAADQADLVLIGIVREARRQGLGRRLLDFMCRDAASRGAARMHLEHAADDGTAAAFYAGAGFKLAGTRQNYYANRSGARDAVVLVRELA
jgi:tRNA threonylcarbamoyladenosine biosynthesis protein TsaB